MKILPDWPKRRPILPPVLAVDTPKGPWGGGNTPGSGGGNGGGGNGDGPRNPWSVPPGGRKGAPRQTALDEFLKRARPGGGGIGPSLPGGANARTLWLIGAAVVVGAWLILTSFHSIGSQQRGVVTYFGRYTGTLEPGIRFTLPAPIATVTKVDVQRIRTEDFPADGAENLTLTGDQNIIDLAYSVRWDVSSPSDYVFQVANPEETVRATAESAMRAVLATTTLEEAIGAGRNNIESRVATLMQAILNDYSAGVRIQGVSIKQASAPASLIDDFNKVTEAQQQAIGNLNRARSTSQQVINRAEGEAAAFDKVYEQYRLAPEVTRRRMYYETMEAVLRKTDKTIVEVPGVTPYLPLDRGRRIPDAAAAAAAPAQTPAPAPATPVPAPGGSR